MGSLTSLKSVANAELASKVDGDGHGLVVKYMNYTHHGNVTLTGQIKKMNEFSVSAQ